MSRFTDLFQEPKVVSESVVEPTPESTPTPVVVEEVKETKVTSILDRIKKKNVTN